MGLTGVNPPGLAIDVQGQTLSVVFSLSNHTDADMNVTVTIDGVDVPRRSLRITVPVDDLGLHDASVFGGFYTQSDRGNPYTASVQVDGEKSYTVATDIRVLSPTHEHVAKPLHKQHHHGVKDLAALLRKLHAA